MKDRIHAWFESRLPWLSAILFASVALDLWPGRWPFALISHLRIWVVLASLVLALLAAFGMRSTKLGRPRTKYAVLCGHALVLAWFLVPLFGVARVGLSSSKDAQQNEPSESRAVLRIAYGNALVGSSNPSAWMNELLASPSDVALVVEASVDLNPSVEAAEEYPHRLLRYRNEPFGMAVVSRYELQEIPRTSDADLQQLQELERIAENHPWLHLRCLHPQGEVRIWLVHPVPPITPSFDREQRQLFEFLGRAALRDAERFPTLVLGDFNASRSSPLLRAFAKEANLRDWDPSFFAQGSWPSALPRFLRIDLDHLYLSHHFEERAQELVSSPHSDHSYLRTSLRFRSRP